MQSVGAIDYLPLSNSESLGMFQVDGYPNDKDQMAEGRWVTPQYFSAMQIPLVAGRTFTNAEFSARQTVIINQAFAQKYFANRNPIGGRINTEEHHIQWSTVVGVIGDVRHSSLEEPAAPQIYHPAGTFGGGYIAVRSTLPPKLSPPKFAPRLHAIDPSQAAGDIQTMGELESVASAQRRFQTSLLTFFAAIALFLALVGLYGLMAYSVSRRTREVGIRMALGAQRTDVMLLVLKKAALLLGLGLVSGLDCLVVRHARHPGISFWRRPARPNYSPVRLCFARGLRLDRSHDSRSPRRFHRSYRSTSDGVRRACMGALEHFHFNSKEDRAGKCGFSFHPSKQACRGPRFEEKPRSV